LSISKRCTEKILTLKPNSEACENLVMGDRSPWMEYMIHEGLLFKGSQLCIPKCSMRDNLLKEKHNGGLVTHFSHDKEFSKLNYSYLSPCMRSNVKRFVDRCIIFKYAKGK
jgi:hypothetical protein